MVMRGWIGGDENFSNHVKYNHQTRDLFHLWSAKNFGYTFGEQELNKIMSLDDYLNMPIDFSDDLLEGYGRGAKDRAKAAQEAARRAAQLAKQGNNPDEAEKAAMAMAQRGDK